METALVIIIPGAALLTWAYSAIWKRHAGAGLRYRIAAGVLAYGIVSSVAYMPLGIVTWGRPQGFWVLLLLLSGLLSIVTAGVIGLGNLLLKRSDSSESLPVQGN